jgi:hypothetical protein
MEGEQDDQGAHVDQFSRDEGGGAEGSYHTIDPLLVEQFPGTPPGEVVAYTVGGMFVVAAAPTAVGYVAGEIAWPVLARAGSAVASWLCLDGDCTNEIITGKVAVYRYLENGLTRYIWTTNNSACRAAEHLRRKGWQIQRIPFLDRLSRLDARSVEQVLIEYYGLDNLYNWINSIARNNPIYEKAIQRGSELLRMLGLLD